jgi:hypothetical protein
MSDEQELTALLGRWQVPWLAEENEDSTREITVGEKDRYGFNSHSDRVTGYGGFYTAFKFDTAGKFISMGAWE